MARTTSAALRALCLVVVMLGSFGQAVARVESKDDFAAHQHSPAFLGFMARHGKDYCGSHAKACQLSVLRCARAPPTKLFVGRAGSRERTKDPFQKN